MRFRIARHVPFSSSWFFGDSGSIEGGMISARDSGTHAGT
jgi:hypothetical protein